MAQEDNKTRVQRVLNEAFTKGNLNALDELYAPN